MRDYAMLLPQFWTGATGKKLRAGGMECQVLALYLVSSPLSNMIGLYYLPLPTLCHETGLTMEGALKALRRVEDASFAFYDEAEEVIWVPEMARYQIADELKPKDNRVKSVAKEAVKYCKSRFFKEFCGRYQDAFHIGSELKIQLARKAPSKPLRSQEQEQDQEQNQEHSARAEKNEDPKSREGASADFRDDAGKIQAELAARIAAANSKSRKADEAAHAETPGFKDALAAIDGWSKAAPSANGRGYPLMVENDEARPVRNLIDFLQNPELAKSVLWQGTQVRPELLVTQAVDALRKSGNVKFKSPEFVCGCVKKELAHWAESGVANTANSGKPTPPKPKTGRWTP